jgi:hypothetical protein
MTTQMTGSHHSTYKAIFQHPVARNLDWRDVRSMLLALADDVQESSGNLKVTRNGRTLVLHPPVRRAFSDIHELMNIRHFLEESGVLPPGAAAPGAHLLVVIDHREARVYKTEMHGAVPQRITPYNPGGFGRHLHYVQDESSGQRKPERKSFYEAVAQTLRGAEKVLIFGSGTGASSAMERLLAELKQEHADVAGRIVGSIVLDVQHLTEDQLLAKAREFYASVAA